MTQTLWHPQFQVQIHDEGPGPEAAALVAEPDESSEIPPGVVLGPGRRVVLARTSMVWLRAESWRVGDLVSVTPTIVGQRRLTPVATVVQTEEGPRWFLVWPTALHIKSSPWMSLPESSRSLFGVVVTRTIAEIPPVGSEPGDLVFAHPALAPALRCGPWRPGDQLWFRGSDGRDTFLASMEAGTWRDARGRSHVDLDVLDAAAAEPEDVGDERAGVSLLVWRPAKDAQRHRAREVEAVEGLRRPGDVELLRVMGASFLEARLFLPGDQVWVQDNDSEDARLMAVAVEDGLDGERTSWRASAMGVPTSLHPRLTLHPAQNQVISVSRPVAAPQEKTHRALVMKLSGARAIIVAADHDDVPTTGQPALAEVVSNDVGFEGIGLWVVELRVVLGDVAPVWREVVASRRRATAVEAWRFSQGEDPLAGGGDRWVPVDVVFDDDGEPAQQTSATEVGGSLVLAVATRDGDAWSSWGVHCPDAGLEEILAGDPSGISRAGTRPARPRDGAGLYAAKLEEALGRADAAVRDLRDENEALRRRIGAVVFEVRCEVCGEFVDVEPPMPGDKAGRVWRTAAHGEPVGTCEGGGAVALTSEMIEDLARRAGRLSEEPATKISRPAERVRVAMARDAFWRLYRRWVGASGNLHMERAFKYAAGASLVAGKILDCRLTAGARSASDVDALVDLVAEVLGRSRTEPQEYAARQDCIAELVHEMKLANPTEPARIAESLKLVATRLKKLAYLWLYEIPGDEFGYIAQWAGGFVGALGAVADELARRETVTSQGLTMLAVDAITTRRSQAVNEVAIAVFDRLRAELETAADKGFDDEEATASKVVEVRCPGSGRPARECGVDEIGRRTCHCDGAFDVPDDGVLPEHGRGWVLASETPASSGE